MARGRHPVGATPDRRYKPLVFEQVKVVLPPSIFFRGAHDILVKDQKILLLFKLNEHFTQKIIVTLHLLNPPCSVG